MIGLGTYKLNDDATFEIVKHGLELGYRLIDTAQLYNNEAAVGRAIKESNIARKDITIVTKVRISEIEKGKSAIIESILSSLQKLNLEYIDILLLHAPVKDKLLESWEILEDAFLGFIPDLQHKIKSIGVSNYGISDLQTILESCTVKPMYNQIELSPFCQRTELVNFCRLNGIKIMAHSSLVKGRMFSNDVIQNICTKHKCQPAKVLIDWALMNGYIALPRTSNLQHLKHNFNTKQIVDSDDMNTLNNINESYLTHEQYANL